MSLLEINLHGPRPVYRPGERLSGRVRWELDRRTALVELRLMWHIEGAAIPEAGVVEVIRIDRPVQVEEREFEFLLPEGPYSYIGRFGALTWGVEVVTLPAQEHVLARFDLSPLDGRIHLLVAGRADSLPPSH